MTSIANMMTNNNQNFGTKSANDEKLPGTNGIKDDEKLPGTGDNGKKEESVSDMFMKLLLAQIQNQDPTNPTSSTEYVNQLSQMANMESMNAMSGTMAAVAGLVGDMQALTSASLVGKQVYVKTDKIQLEDQPLEGRLTLESPAGSVKVKVTDSSGKEVTIDLGRQEKGMVDFEIDPAKLGLKPGEYKLKVETDTEEKDIPTEICGTVNSVRIDQKTQQLMVKVPGVGEVPHYTITQYGQQPSDGGKDKDDDKETKPTPVPEFTA